MTIIDAMEDPNIFGRWFQGPSWDTWKVFLLGLFSLPMTPLQAETFRHFTGGREPGEAIAECWMQIGRRGGKSLVAALIAVYVAIFRDVRPHLGPGERAVVMCLAADRRQARVITRYIAGFLEGSPMLASLIESRRAEAIDLKNRVSVEVHAADFRHVRGYTVAAVVADEVAFWPAEGSVSPDVEILNALRPGLTTLPGSLLLALSSPYARRGALWEAYSRHFGKPGGVLVWNADSLSMNPTLPPHVVTRAFEDDPVVAASEYGRDGRVEFRSDVETFIKRETVDDLVIPDRHELPAMSGCRYFGFTDPSGGSRDSMTLAIAHLEKDVVVLDLVLERRPPFAPESVVAEFADALKRYRISEIRSDFYGGLWPTDRYKAHLIKVTRSEKSKSEIYLEFLPLLNGSRVELLDHPRLITQLCSLERRTARGGRDSVDHRLGAQDDVINSAAGALVMAAASKRSALITRITLPDLTRPSPSRLGDVFVGGHHHQGEI